MAVTENWRNNSPFQEWLPLNIVSIERIPHKTDADLQIKVGLYDLVFLGSLMEELCIKKSGVGLSAFQVGIPLPFFVASNDGNKFVYYYECQYEGVSDLTKSIEGCLSILDETKSPKRFLLQRYASIRCQGKKICFDGETCLQPFDQTFDDISAIVLQHEIDHQMSRLISDIGTEIQII